MQNEMKKSAIMTTELISVVICAYAHERWDRLVAAVASLQKQTLVAREIIVVIDHNQGLLLQAQAYFVGVKVIENKETRGLSGARNSGIAVAGGALIAFLDDDAVAEADWLLHLHAALRDPRILGVGSAVLPAWEGRRPSWFPSEFLWVVGCTYLGMPEGSVPIRNPIGASMCVRAEVFQTVGGFRNGIGRVGTLPIGCEETELCIRACQHWPERTFLYVPQTFVSHFVPRQRATWRYFFTRCYAEGISKAAIGRFVGTKAALSAESAYTMRTLPAGVVRNFADLLRRHQLAGCARALAISTGLGITTIGYLVGKYAPLSLNREPEAVSLPSLL